MSTREALIAAGLLEEDAVTQSPRLEGRPVLRIGELLPRRLRMRDDEPTHVWLLTRRERAIRDAEQRAYRKASR
jgi:hypothetical protein